MPFIAKAIELTSDEIDKLEVLLRQKTSVSQGVAERARIVILAGEGLTNQQIIKRTGLHRNSVSKWRKRYLLGGLEAIYDKPRPGQPIKHKPSRIQQVITAVCGKPPKGHGRWSHRLLAIHMKMPKATIQGILKKFDLQPHRLRTFNFSPDPQFEEKLLEVVGLYLNPPANAIVLCMDEKTGIQALDRTQPMLPLRGGKPGCVSNEYVRHGTRTLLATLDIQSGKATTWVNKTRKSADFVKFMDQVVGEYPGKRLYVVMDNLNTHKGVLAREWLENHPQVSFHFTPTHASWVNLAECFFSILTRQGLQQAVHRSAAELTKFLHAFVKSYNKTCGPFVWTKGPEKLRRIIELTKEFQNSMHAK